MEILRVFPKLIWHIRKAKVPNSQIQSRIHQTTWVWKSPNYQNWSSHRCLKLSPNLNLDDQRSFQFVCFLVRDISSLCFPLNFFAKLGLYPFYSLVLHILYSLTIAWQYELKKEGEERAFWGYVVSGRRGSLHWVFLLRIVVSWKVTQPLWIFLFVWTIKWR